MNGRKYGHNYAPRAHGFAIRSRLYPVSYYAPKHHARLNEMMWINLIERYHKFQIGGTPDQLWSNDGRVRDINYGKTLGWWKRAQ